MAVVGLAQGTEARAAGVPGPVLWLIGAAGATAAAASVALALASDHLAAPGVQGALMGGITLAYVFTGLIAWWRRPGNRLGPLMIAAGFGTFLSSVASANAAVPYTIGIAFDLVAAVLFLHVFLAFPSGRLHGHLERTLVGAGYFTAFALQLVGLVLGGFGPDNVVAVFSAPDAAVRVMIA